MPKVIENLREKIISEGRKLLLNNNYKNLSIREIASNCNIGVGTFYNYFSNKEELVSEIFKEDWKKISSLVEQLKYTDEACKEKFKKICTSLDIYVNNYIPVFYEMAMASTDNCRSKVTDKFDIIYNKVSELIDIEKSKGHIVSKLSSYKLSQLIISNLIYLNKNKYMSFDELYDMLKL